jgi:hypothetical protein
MLRDAERLLHRYLVEVVERFGLCPWARAARERGEIRVEVVDAGDAAAAIARIVADPAATMGMVIVPGLDPRALRRLRDELLAARVAEVGIADFHPEAALDASSPARAVAWLRRSPDPMLQVVRLDVLAAARAAPPPPDLAGQAAILAGRAGAPPPAVADRIAAANLATIAARAAEIEAAVVAIHDDRDRVRGWSRGPR